jgi:uncharacterized protein (DUF2132 family)
MLSLPSNDPLHGKTLKAILEALVERYGWEGLSKRIAINCFTHDPSISSSLVFLRKTPWAREKIEALYLRSNGKSVRKHDTFKPLDLGI